jgi:hypothetical protein
MIKSWSSEDYRSYVRYLDEWPGIKYTLHNLKFHRDLCGQNEAVSQHVTTLVRKLAGNQASYLLGNWIAFHFGQINSTLTGLLLPLTRTMRLEKSIRVHKYQATAENFKYNTLNAAAELMLHSVLETLLLLCTRYNDHADNKTPLIISAQKGLAAATQYLLDIDSDVNAIDDSVQTALHYAVKNRDQVIVRMLLEWEANKRTMDNSGRLGHPIAVPNVSFVLDLETQRRLYNTWSFGRRGWTYFQLSMERIVPIPIAWWPFDPPRLDLKYVVTVPQDPRKNTSSTVSGSPDGSVTAIPGSTPPCEHSAPQSSVLLLDGSRPTTHCHHSDVISTLVHSSEKTNGSSAGANDDTSPIVKSVSTSPKYILICFDVTKLRLHSGFQHNCRLRQVEVMNQMCDHEVFPLFRKEYYAICGALRRYLSLRALSHINFVKVDHPSCSLVPSS